MDELKTAVKEAVNERMANDGFPMDELEEGIGISQTIKRGKNAKGLQKDKINESQGMEEYKYPDNADSYSKLLDTAEGQGVITQHERVAQYISHAAKEVATQFDKEVPNPDIKPSLFHLYYEMFLEKIGKKAKGNWNEESVEEGMGTSHTMKRGKNVKGRTADKKKFKKIIRGILEELDFAAWERDYHDKEDYEKEKEKEKDKEKDKD